MNDFIDIFAMREVQPAPTVQKRIALNAFVVARLKVRDLMLDVLKEHRQHLPALCIAQADAVVGLADKLHRIVGDADSADFLALRDDLEAVAKATDGLILAIGNHAIENSHVVDRALFIDVVTNAIDGQAGYELTAASERAEQELIAAE